MGRDDLLADPRFATNTARVQNNDIIDAIVAEFMSRRSQAENLALFDEVGVTVGPVCDAADLMAHPYAVEREVLVELPDEHMGRLPMHNIVPRLSVTPGAFRLPAPGLGEHTREILASVGVGEEELSALARDGTVALMPA